MTNRLSPVSPTRQRGSCFLPRWRVGLSCAVWTCFAATAAAEPPAGAVLHLVNGSRVAGEVRASEDPGVVRWRSPLFTAPLDFPIAAVRAVHYDVPAAPPKPKDEYGVELFGDDVLYGDLVRLTDDEVELNSAALGRLVVRRDQVARIYRLDQTAAVYVGPNGLAGWKDLNEPSQWHEEGGQIVTDQPAATLFASLNIPDKAIIDVELSWRSKPDFTVALGVMESDHAVRNAFRFEVWDGQLVVVGESVRDADAAVLEPAGNQGGHVRVLAYIDRPQGRLFLLSRAGKSLGTLSVAPAKAAPRPPQGFNLCNLLGAVTTGQKPAEPTTGVRLTNYKGDVRLETLRISRWNGVPPQDVRDDRSRLHRTDGSIVYGHLAAYDPAVKRFTVSDAGADTVVAGDAVSDIFLAPPAGKRPAADPAALRVVYQDGSRFSGSVIRLEDDYVTLARSGLAGPTRLPLAGARSLVGLRGADEPAAAADGRSGRFEFGGVSLKGRLVAGSEPLVWKADLARDPAPLTPGLSGRIVYRDPPSPAPKPPVTRRMGMIVMNGGVPAPAPPAGPPLPTTGSKSMHLRTGDTVPCEIIRIDETGVTIKSPSTDATFIPQDKIKSVELIPTKNAPSLDETKRDRLLTLPRTQRGAPPTHLICSSNGDFLRGRIVEMDGDHLKVDVRLETKSVPRDRVAQIIWLHADELGDGKTAPPASADGPKQTRAQTVNARGNRLTFVVTKADGETIAGVSDVLGPCRAAVADADEVLLGAAIEQSAAKLAYHDWKLHHAPDPKFVTADAGGGGSAGTESPLVGQPAPPFHLDRLDGSRFDLADRKGKVVVLDFWATWCGPCMQSMPLVEEVIDGYADRNVELLAVNMEEQPDQVKSVVERHKFKVSVAIDSDGAVAAKYAVTAIPQTVVIDRDGNIARLFVGGGKATAEALKKALDELMAK
jgi:peroxiredoxin